MILQMFKFFKHFPVFYGFVIKNTLLVLLSIDKKDILLYNGGVYF